MTRRPALHAYTARSFTGQCGKFHVDLIYADDDCEIVHETLTWAQKRGWQFAGPRREYDTLRDAIRAAIAGLRAISASRVPRQAVDRLCSEAARGLPPESLK